MSKHQTLATRDVQFTVELTDDPARLAGVVPEWEDLAARALEPNPMYEPWMLLPAIRLSAEEERPQFSLVWMRDARRGDERPKLAGLFPWRRVRRFRGIPASALTSWTPRSWRLGTPLVRREEAAGCLKALLDWLEQGRSHPTVLEFRFLAADGAFEGLLADALRERNTMVIAGRDVSRPLLRPAASAEAYLERSLSAVGFRSIRRKTKRLARLGTLETVALEGGDDAAPWIDAFLRLEAGGWRSRPAIASPRSDLLFAYQTLAAAHQRNRLDMGGIDLEGRPVARYCSIRCGDGAYAFRTAFDQQFRAHSPAVLAEVEAVRRAHAAPGLQWVDSIGDADDLTRARIWGERRTVRSVIVGAGVWGELWVSMLPVMHWTRRRMASAGSLLVRSARLGRSAAAERAPL